MSAVMQPVGARPIQRIRYTHDAMVDLIVANPAISQNELASHFGYTAAWVSTILASDAFAMRLAERRDKLVDPLIRASIEEHTKGLMLRSMEILQEKLAKPSDQIPDNLVLKSFELATKAAGFGIAIAQPLAAPQADRLTILADRLIMLNPSRGSPNGEVPKEAQIIEVEASHAGGGAQPTAALQATAPDTSSSHSDAQADGRSGLVPAVPPQ